MHVAPLFIAETSPNDLRGKLISFKEAAIVGGIVAPVPSLVAVKIGMRSINVAYPLSC